ncbi:AraC family transcriptional regulator [Aquabacterium lacunae]|nr:AraC family transcriptional regulator [Aquabacterium lacunae]
MLISPINFKILATALDIEGHDGMRALQAVGFRDLDEVAEDGPWLPAEQLDRMMAEAIHVSGDDTFGLVVGRSLALMRYGPIAPLAMSSPSLRQILADVRRFGRLLLPEAEWELVESGGLAGIRVQPVVHGGLSGHFRCDQVATSGMMLLRMVGWGPNDIVRVDLPYHPRPEQMPRYQGVFGALLNPGAAHCTLWFDPRLLDLHMPTSDPVANVAARARAESALAAMQAGSDLAETVREWLLASLPRWPSVQETAAQLRMTERSLRRQLEQLGTSHAELLQSCQVLMAERLLADAERPIKQVADALGFGSVHSFHRAFRRWRGETPGGWRDRQLGLSPVPAIPGMATADAD